MKYYLIKQNLNNFIKANQTRKFDYKIQDSKHNKQSGWLINKIKTFQKVH
jgi:hypothetical protein